MNCPRRRSKMEYLRERSNPRKKALAFYCPRCKRFRFTFELPSKDLLTLFLDSIEPTDYLPSEQDKEAVSEREISISPLPQRGNIPATPS
jgi:hypothetical protein